MKSRYGRGAEIALKATTGRLMPPDEWALRHRVLRIVLALHLPVIAALAASRPHPTLGTAVACALPVGALLGTLLSKTRFDRSLCVAFGLLSCSGSMVYLADGLNGTQAHYFVIIALVALYEDRRTYALSIVYVFLQYGTLALAMPRAINPSGNGDVSAALLVRSAFILGIAAVQLAFWNHIKASQEREEAERYVARNLQRSLLPPTTPIVKGASVATSYRPLDEVGVGGDWFDVIPLPGRHCGLTIGDVSGHGIEAAIVMAQLRSGSRAFGIQGMQPSSVMEWMNRFMSAASEDTIATSAYVLVDCRTGLVRYSTAGHLPPLIVSDYCTRFADIDPGMPLGVDPDATFTQSSMVLHPGETLVLYTDGLVERRGSTIEVGMDGLLEHAKQGVGLAAGALQKHLLQYADTSQDDTAVLVFQRDS